MMLRLAAPGLLLPALFTAPSSQATTSLRGQTAAILQEALTAGDRSSVVDAAGMTRSGQWIVSLEPIAPIDPAQRRLVIVGGLDGRADSAGAVLQFIRWWFGDAAAGHLRHVWQIAALPCALPDSCGGEPHAAPPRRSGVPAGRRFLQCWPGRSRVLDIYRRQLKGMIRNQAAGGMWRQVVDEPGSYRELTVTAMTVAAMARGLRLGWLDASVRPVLDRAWRALLARVGDEGSLMDVCTGTGAGPTKQYYLDRAAITGFDDRGRAMALTAALEMAELENARAER